MRRVARFIPGVLGAALICAGVAVVWWPGSLMLAGGFLLMLDRKLP